MNSLVNGNKFTAYNWLVVIILQTEKHGNFLGWLSCKQIDFSWVIQTEIKRDILSAYD
jgi:hypothetical protein